MDSVKRCVKRRPERGGSRPAVPDVPSHRAPDAVTGFPPTLTLTPALSPGVEPVEPVEPERESR